MNKPVIVGSLRSPIDIIGGKLSHLSAIDIGIEVSTALLSRYKISPKMLDYIFIGQVAQTPLYSNAARILGAKIGSKCPAITFHSNCTSSLAALSSAFDKIRLGEANIVLIGGIESMSQMHYMANIDRKDKRFRTSEKVKEFWNDAKDKMELVDLMQRGLTCGITGLSMIEISEIIAANYQVKSEEHTKFVTESYKRLANNIDHSSYIHPIGDLKEDELSKNYKDKDENYFARSPIIFKKDDLLNKPNFIKYLHKKQDFNPVVSRHSAVSNADGAGFLLVMSEEKAKQFGYYIQGEIVDVDCTAISPEVALLAPGYSIPKLLDKNKISFDAPYFDIHMPFAASALGYFNMCARKYNQDWYKKFYDGDINRYDNSFIGHPLAATNIRNIINGLKVLYEDKNKNYSVISGCAAGGISHSVLIKKYEN